MDTHINSICKTAFYHLYNIRRIRKFLNSECTKILVNASYCAMFLFWITKMLLNTVLRGVYTTEQKWHGSDKNWNGSNSFCKETEKFYPFRVGSIGAYGPVAERIKLHCFFAKTVGTVPVFVGSVPFLLCRVNAPLHSATAWQFRDKIFKILCVLQYRISCIFSQSVRNIRFIECCLVPDHQEVVKI